MRIVPSFRAFAAWALAAAARATEPADVTFSNQKNLNAANGWSAEAGLMTVVDDALVEGGESLVVEGHCTAASPVRSRPTRTCARRR